MADQLSQLDASLRKDLRSFEPITSAAEVTAQVPPETQKVLDVIMGKDYASRLGLRRGMAFSLTALLFLQNIWVFYLVTVALQAKELPSLQLIFASLVGATLLETYQAMKVIVQFLFQEINYRPKK